jgi:endonuclease/exonuclease/phosphatase family metal-dependent hydrolase
VSGEKASSPVLSVMTQNLYVGIDVTPIVNARPSDMPDLVATAYASVQATDFKQRAEVIAKAVAKHAPHVLALQEAALWCMRTPSSLADGGGWRAATEPKWNFTALLIDALWQYGVHYREVGRMVSVNAQSPLRLDGALSDLRMIDHTTMLVLEDDEFRVLGVTADRYAAHLSVRIANDMVTRYRGYVAIDAQLAGHQVRIVDTHLEPLSDSLQITQCEELLAGPAAHDGRIVVAGDFNSPADGLGTPTYGKVRAAGFGDVWASVGSGEGFTCCQDTGLANAESELSDRRDFIFFRGGLKPLAADLILNNGDARTPAGIWASDHAGLVGRFALV